MIDTAGSEPKSHTSSALLHRHLISAFGQDPVVMSRLSIQTTSSTNPLQDVVQTIAGSSSTGPGSSLAGPGSGVGISDVAKVGLPSSSIGGVTAHVTAPNGYLSTIHSMGTVSTATQPMVAVGAYPEQHQQHYCYPYPAAADAAAAGATPIPIPRGGRTPSITTQTPPGTTAAVLQPTASGTGTAKRGGPTTGHPEATGGTDSTGATAMPPAGPYLPPSSTTPGSIPPQAAAAAAAATAAGLGSLCRFSFNFPSLGCSPIWPWTVVGGGEGDAGAGAQDPGLPLSHVLLRLGAKAGQWLTVLIMEVCDAGTLLEVGAGNYGICIL